MDRFNGKHCANSILFNIVMAYLINAQQNFPVKKIWNITVDAIYMADTVYKQPARYFDVKGTAIFPKRACCPVVRAEPITSFINLSYHWRCIRTQLFLSGSQWSPGGMYNLNPRKANRKFVQCSEHMDKYICTFTIKYQWYDPYLIGIFIGFLCDDYNENQKLSLKDLHAEIDLNVVSNISQCERIIEGTSSLHCENFYKYVSFPNLMGHLSQSEAKQTLDLFASLLNRDSGPCYQHQAYFVCQGLFPQCPPPENEAPGGTYMTDHLVAVCREMCIEAFNACFLGQFQFLTDENFCSVYKSLNDSELCVYKNVTCNSIPNGTNAEAMDVQDIYYVGDTVSYVCDSNYGIEGDSER